MWTMGVSTDQRLEIFLKINFFQLIKNKINFNIHAIKQNKFLFWSHPKDIRHIVYPSPLCQEVGEHASLRSSGTITGHCVDQNS